MAGRDVHIRRCNVRLRRSAADGAALLERDDHLAFARRMQPLVIGMIEQFVAERLAREGDEFDVARLDIELALPADVQRGAVPLARAAIRQRVDAAVSSAVVRARAAGLVAARHEIRLPDPPVVDPAPANLPSLPDGILAVLAEWFEQRQLALRLSLLGPIALVRLFERAVQALQRLAPESAGDGDVADAETSPIDQTGQACGTEVQLRDWIARVALWARHADPGEGAGPRGEQRGLLLAQAMRLTPLADGLLVSVRRGPAPDAPLREASGDAVPLPDSPAARFESPSSPYETAARSPLRTPVPSSVLQDGRYDIACALPYLALLRLAEHGVLAGLPDDGPALAALAYAIALKHMSPSPDSRRPWREDLAKAAAIVAGLAEAPDGAALVHAAGRAEALLDLASGAVNAAMRPALIELAALPAVHDAGHVIAFDPVGFYPAGAVPAAALGEILGGTHALLVMPPGDAAGLRLAAEGGLKAVCAGMPAAREAFVSVSGPRGWRGMSTIPVQALAGHHHKLRALGERAERGQAIWLALTERRPLAASAAQAQIAPLDRCAALMAGFGLADIAYRLSQHDPSAWRDPDPLLALERFGDLSARVDVSPGEVAVTLPLGARFADLFATGLLDATPRLPWLRGRVLRVGGG